MWASAAALLFASCGYGTAGVIVGSKGSSGGATPVLEAFEVATPKVSPCRLRLDANTPVRIELFYDVGAGEKPMTLLGAPGVTANEVALSAAEAEVEWNFEGDLGSAGYNDHVRLAARRGGVLVSGGELTLGIGNDAPEVLGDVEVELNGDEASGTTGIELIVADSSNDVVSVEIEFDVQGDDPDVGWRPARPALLDPSDETPVKSIGNVQVEASGTKLTFFWDTRYDLPMIERDVRLRATPSDEVLTGTPVVSSTLRVDNNAVPILQLDLGPLILNPDERRGLPIPYRVIDEEGDLVQVVFQWRREGEEFPPLPSDITALDAILADEALRRELHVCTPYPHFATGRVVSVDDDARVRLSELASGESWLLAAGLEGLTLELLRPSSIPAAPTWPSSSLIAPVAAVPLGDGRKALVLDGPSNGRLVELELATGSERRIATLGQGVPTALSLERGGATALVALDDAGAWRIVRVELATGDPTELVVSDGSEPAPVRGIASLGANRAVFTAGSTLFELDTNDPSTPRLSALRTNLDTPFGVAVDPLLSNRVYVSERGADRILAIELDSRGQLPVVVDATGLPAGALDAPEALALERDGARLLVMTSSPGGYQLVGVDLLEGRDAAAPGGNAAFRIGPPSTANVTSLAAGDAGLRLACRPGSGELLVAGGIEQRRVITAYDPLSREVSVEPPFDPAPRDGLSWRVAAESRGLVRATAQGVTRSFLWDSTDARSGDISLRATAHDEEFALPVDAAAAKQVRAPLEVDLPVVLAAGEIDWPFAVLTADLDGDGDLDVVSANHGSGHTGGEPDCQGAGGDDLTLFFQNENGTFEPAESIGDSSTTDGPRGLAAADLDGDGLVDLVSANYCGNDLAVFLQQPSSPGSFGAPIPVGGPGTTNGPAAVAAADLDGDGDLDLVSANLDGHDVTIFWQGSSPCDFGANPCVLTNAEMNGPASVAVADLDGDGDLDVICANSFASENRGFTDGNLTLFFQDAGTFEETYTLRDAASMRSPRAVVAADLDGDGDLDLVCANRRSDNLMVFFQDAPGSFEEPPLVLVSSSQPVALAVADLDADGDLDIVSANPAFDSLRVFFQDSPGGFGATPVVLGDPVTTYTAFAVAAADLDGDGDIDLVSANDQRDAGGNLGGPGNLAVFHQFTPGRFAAAPLTLGGVGETPVPSNPELVDVDGDGDLDVVTAIRGVGPSFPEYVAIFTQRSSGDFETAPRRVGSGTIRGPRSVRATDLDGDGDIDLISANDDNLTVFLRDASGGYPSAPSLVLGKTVPTTAPVSVAAADLDGDGYLDLVSANNGGNDLTVFFQDPVFPELFPTAISLGDDVLTNAPNAVAVADLDGNGYLDIVSANGRSNDLAIFLQRSARVFTHDRNLGGPGATRDPASVLAADIDGDGAVDLVSANRASDDLTIFFQSPGVLGSFVRVTVGSPATMDGPASVAAADVDGDGDLDLVVANEVGRDAVVFLQLTPRRFAVEPLVLDPEGAIPIAVATGDVDGDGDVDLVLASGSSLSTSGNLKVFFGGR